LVYRRQHLLCRAVPSVHPTWKRAKSATSDQGTPAEVTSLEAVEGVLDLSFDIEASPSVSGGGLTIRATRFVAEVAASPSRETTLPRFGRLARASALLLMQA
jgi:hypothetical protein